MSDELMAGHFLLSLMLGYGVACFFTRVGRIWQRWGAFIGSFFIVAIFISLAMMSTAVVTMSHDLAMTASYALGFIVGFVKR